MIQLSFSAAQKYLQSPFAYLMHYLLKVRPEKVGSALVFGAAIDSGLNSLLTKTGNPYQTFDDAFSTTKINGKEVDLRSTELVRYSKADLDESIWIDEDKVLASMWNPSWVSLRRKGHLIIKAYEEQVIPKIKRVLAVQKAIELKNECGDTFIGYVDLIAELNDGKIYILDNKTTSVKYDDDAATNSEQLATYYEAVAREFGATRVGFIVIPKNIRKKKEPLIPIEIHLGDIKEETLNKTFQMYDDVLKGIKRGEFRCSGCRNAKFGCDYKKFCETGDMTGLVKIEDKPRVDK